ncbi:MAG: arsenic efflux protein [Clostridia bacterium]|nr:arsenic efflux protein [Clostridia bacterium]
MHKFLHVVEHGFIDSIKMLPIIILVYFLIEFLEYKQAMNVKNGSLLNKKHSPIFGALFGVMPQCGFSVVATDLYSKKKLNIGALIAVYISTSDEALPIMLSNFKSIKMLLPLVLIKIVVGVIVGYATQLIFDNVLYKEQKILLKQTISANKEQNVEKSFKHEVAKIELVEAEDHHHDGHEHLHHDHHKEENKLKQEEIHIGCCNHDIEHKKFDWKHPLLHSLKIILTILIINIAMGLIIEVGFTG